MLLGHRACLGTASVNTLCGVRRGLQVTNSKNDTNLVSEGHVLSAINACQGFSVIFEAALPWYVPTLLFSPALITGYFGHFPGPKPIAPPPCPAARSQLTSGSRAAPLPLRSGHASAVDSDSGVVDSGAVRPAVISGAVGPAVESPLPAVGSAVPLSGPLSVGT